MQPGRGRASLFLVLLGLSMVPLIVAPPEKGTETRGDEIVEETIGTTAERLDEYSTTGYLMKRSFTSGQKELQQAIDNMSTGQQFPVIYHESPSERTERLLKEAQQILRGLKSYKKRFWLEAFSYFLENMLNKVKPERKYKKSNASIEIVRENFVTGVNSLSFNRSPMPLVTANFEHEESNMQAFATVPPQLEEDSVATLPQKSKSTQSDKVKVTALSEFVDNSLHSPTIISWETSNLQESLANPESPKANKAQEYQGIRISTETYIPHESQDMTVSSEANIPHESQAVHLSSETNNPQESEAAHEISETNNSQEPQSMPESSETSRNLEQISSSKPQFSEQEPSFPYLATLRIVPETNQQHVDKLASDDQTSFAAMARVISVLDNIQKHKKITNNKLINNRIEEIDYIDELEKELLELSRIQALENSKNTSTSANTTDMSPPTTGVKRNSFQLMDEKPELSVGGILQKSPSLPQSSKESPLITDKTAPDHSVSESSHQQTVQLTSEAQSALPKEERAISIHDQEVTTTALVQNDNEKREEEIVKEMERMEEKEVEIVKELEMEEEKEQEKEEEEKDELVRELEELPRLAALERAHSTSIPFIKPIDVLTPAPTVKKRRFVTNYQAVNIRELHRLGANPKEIKEAMGMNSLQSPDGLELVKIGQDPENNKVHNSNADETMIYKINPNTWKPFGSPYPPKPYTNDSYEGRHINLPSMNERIVTTKLQGGYHWGHYNARMRTHPRNIHNTLRKLQRENNILKTRLMSFTQTNGNINKIRGVTFSGPNRLNQFLPHETRYPTELSLGQNVQNTGGAPPMYTPYPYITNSVPKNFTLKEDMGKTSTLASKPLPQNTNSEFSDEMKRELRDGKVILLSDSVVRSNFEPEKERDEGGKGTKFVHGGGETGIQAQN